MDELRSVVRIDVELEADVPVLVVDGLLDGVTYQTLRDTVIKAALDEPPAVLVDVDRLEVPSGSAWAVFTSARWHVSVWPDVPIMLICKYPAKRRAIAASAVTRYVPVHPTRQVALASLGDRSLQMRRRARNQLSRSRVSVSVARDLVTEWLTKWEISELIPVAATVATVFVENVLDHTESEPVLIVESHQGAVTVAVEDCNAHHPGRHEDAARGTDIVSGLAIVSALSRAWGTTPTSSGKTVWALVGPENRL